MLQKIFHRIIDICDFIKTYSQHLPRAYSAIFSMRCSVVLLRGRTPVGAMPVTVLYVGRLLNYQYLVRTVLRDHEEIENIRSTLLSYRKYSARLAGSADVTIMDIGWPYHGWANRRNAFMQLPDWVNMAVDLGDDWESVVRSFRHSARNNDLRLIRRNNYRCVPSRDPAEIERFYDEMYLPFVHGRHFTDGVIAPRRHVVRRAGQGWLLKVLRDEEVVVAGVVYPELDVLYFLWMGVARAYVESVPEAAISALYVFGIRHAFDEGLSAVDFTGTRPFLNDGAFRFKRKWGSIIEDTFSPSSILIKAQKNNDHAARFFQDNPMLVRHGGKLEMRVVVCDENVDLDTFGRLEKQYACAGIDTITVIEIGDRDRFTVKAIADTACHFRHVQCRLDEFGGFLLDRDNAASSD